MVPFFAVAVACIFAGKDSRTLAIVNIVAQTMGEEPFLISIIMLVVEIDLELLHAGLQQIEIPTLRVGTGGADKLQIGVFGAEGGVELP